MINTSFSYINNKTKDQNANKYYFMIRFHITNDERILKMLQKC